jgi:hypothetical protein
MKAIQIFMLRMLVPVLIASTSVAVVRNAQQPSAPVPSSGEEEIAWVCPMHPDYTAASPGMCPLCKMALVSATPYDVRDYQLDFQTVPAVVKPGEKATLRFKISHPGTSQPVKSFLTVHDRQYHLFVISQDMEYFQHIHPAQESDGTWSIDVTLPKPGYYKILSDFLPGGGSVQFIGRPLVTAGYTGDLTGDSARLVPDTVLTKAVDEVTATVSYNPSFEVGLYGHLNFHLTDTGTGRPITDLQTYLGAFGHTLIMSEDMVHYVHSHPLDLSAPTNSESGGGPRPFMLPTGVDPETLRGGPDVSFEGLIPKPGRYRAWTQFRRDDKLYTFAYTFSVAASK